MSKKQSIILIIVTFLVGLLVTAGSYAYWSWQSNVNKAVSFNTSKELREYIVYDEGESKFVGDFKTSATHTSGLHSTISIKKKPEASNIDLVATIFMDVNAIGTNMANSPALKWTVTSGNSTSGGTILSSGNFVGSSNGKTLMLLP